MWDKQCKIIEISTRSSSDLPSSSCIFVHPISSSPQSAWPGCKSWTHIGSSNLQTKPPWFELQVLKNKRKQYRRKGMWKQLGLRPLATCCKQRTQGQVRQEDHIQDMVDQAVPRLTCCVKVHKTTTKIRRKRGIMWCHRLSKRVNMLQTKTQLNSVRTTNVCVHECIYTVIMCIYIMYTYNTIHFYEPHIK